MKSSDDLLNAVGNKKFATVLADPRGSFKTEQENGARAKDCSVIQPCRFKK